MPKLGHSFLRGLLIRLRVSKSEKENTVAIAIIIRLRPGCKHNIAGVLTPTIVARSLWYSECCDCVPKLGHLSLQPCVLAGAMPQTGASPVAMLD